MESPIVVSSPRPNLGLPSGPLCPCVHLIYHLAMIGQEGPDSDEPIKIRSCILLGTTVVGSDGFRWHLTLGSWCPYSHPTQRWFKILLATASSSIYGSDGFRWIQTIQLKPGGSSLGNSKHQQLDRMASYAQVCDIIHIPHKDGSTSEGV